MEINSYDVLCPYCQNKCGDVDSFEGENIWNEEPLDFECDECGKKFEGKRCVTIDYRTERDCSLNGEKCEAGKYHCKKCDSYDINIKLKIDADQKGDEQNG